jgi:hypothetical protein
VTFHVKHALSVACVGDSETGCGCVVYSLPVVLSARSRPSAWPTLHQQLQRLHSHRRGRRRRLFCRPSLRACPCWRQVSLPETLRHLYLLLPFPFPRLVWCFRLERLERLERVSMLLTLLSAWLPRPCLALSTCERADDEECVTSCRVKSRARRVERAHASVGRVTSQVAVSQVARTSLRNTPQHSHSARSLARPYRAELEEEKEAGGRGQAGGGAQALLTSPLLTSSRATPHREPLTQFDLGKKTN